MSIAFPELVVQVHNPEEGGGGDAPAVNESLSPAGAQINALSCVSL
jgi:hypothetical protein